MKFLKVKLSGCFNSFRYPDFHTYHKTLPLPTKTTISGMLGAALGISPEEVNEKWLKPKRFEVGIVGQSNGKSNDLWQIRKYKSDNINKYYKGEIDKPYFTSVIMRELLYASRYVLYFHFENEKDYIEIEAAIKNPDWALSLGREDELVKIDNVCMIELNQKENIFFQNTVIPIDISQFQYTIDKEYLEKAEGNLLSLRPYVVKLPISFNYNEDSSRVAGVYQTYSFIFNLPVQIDNLIGWIDEKENTAFCLI
ncbi:MAG: CRISPR-associated protein Cas5 [Bacteroidales bacterium]|nr:CRISPR-associated protein Cas5 [Bacteroidales bacterium]